MSDAALKVTFAGPLVTVQDGGRPGHMRYGVPASGPMDRLAFAAANAAVGNAPGTPGIEISLGGLMLTCAAGPVTVAVAGGDFAIDHDGLKTRSWTVLTLQKGAKLAIRAGAAGSWAYLAFAGRLDRPGWLGHQATHALSGFGGGVVKAGQVLTIRDASALASREGDIPKPPLAAGPARIVLGPQDQHFLPEALDNLQSTPYALTEHFDRMGVRLAGAPLPMGAALSIPSEPIVRGTLQVSGDGVPTLLLADHQTTGGYPKIATVISADLDRLVQLRHRDQIRFQAVTAAQAIAAARAHAAQTTDYLAQVAIPRGTMAERLMRENLISGVVSSDDLS